MHVLLAAGNNKAKIDQKFQSDERQLTLETFDNVYEFLNAMSSSTNPWGKAILMSSALNGKAEDEVDEVMELFRDELMKRPEAIGVVIDKNNQYRDYVYGIVKSQHKVNYLNFDKIVLSTVISVIQGSLDAEEEDDYQMPTRGTPQIEEPQPPAPPVYEDMTPPSPPTPPEYVPEPPAPPSPPVQPQIQQTAPAPNRNEIADMVALMKARKRMFTITGSPRSGVSGTVANMAMAAAIYGVRTLIIDMDMINRAQFGYYPQNFQEFDTRYVYGLSNALRDYMTGPEGMWIINDYLSILGLDFCVQDARVQEGYADDLKFHEMLSYMKRFFDVILIDMPFSRLKKYPHAISDSECCAYLMENDILSLCNFMHNMVPEEFDTTSNYHLFEASFGLIINKFSEEHTYMKRPIMPNEIPELL